MISPPNTQFAGSFPREHRHAAAQFDRIHRSQRIAFGKFGRKTSIAVTQHQKAPRRCDFLKKLPSSPFERAPKTRYSKSR
jgi:hypothetical protein